MGLESATTIATLQSGNPTANDPTREGDDHMRMIKRVLKSVFPGSAGQGFAEAITASEAELNYVKGATSSIQEQLNTLSNAIGETAGNPSVPAGTNMLVYGSSAPLGWTRRTDINDYAVVVESSLVNPGGGIGSDSPSSHIHYHDTGSHALTIAEMPSHNHAIKMTTVNPGSTAPFNGSSGSDTEYTEYTGGGASHNHGGTANVAFQPRHISVLLCNKAA